MRRRLATTAVLISLLAAGAAWAADPDTTPPTGSVTGSPALLAKTDVMTMGIKVAADDHGGGGVASIHLFYAPAGGAAQHIRDFDPGKATPDTFRDGMTWDTGLRLLPIGKYTLSAKLYDRAENVRTVSFPFEIRDAADVPKQDVDLDVTPHTSGGTLTLKVRTSPASARGKLRVVVLRRNKSGDYRVFKKYEHKAGATWTLEADLGDGAYRWQAFYDGKAPYASAKTPLKSFTL
jgi:hypothetical protein